MMIRYFASTTGAAGWFAFEYLRSLLRIGPVRLFGTPMLDLSGQWQACARLMATPLDETFVNVVCCHPTAWVRMLRIEMPNVDARGNVLSTEVTTGTAEIYTRNAKRNVLIVSAPPPDPGPLRETAMRYEAIVVPTPRIAEDWRRIGCESRVVPVPVIDHDALRAVILDLNN